MTELLYQIMQLKATSGSYTVHATDYPLLPLVWAWNVMLELNSDAIESNYDDRWTIIPESYNGRPFRPTSRP
jgi:hypothetical protein